MKKWILAAVGVLTLILFGFLMLRNFGLTREIQHHQTRIRELEMILKFGRSFECDDSAYIDASTSLARCGIPREVWFEYPFLTYESRLSVSDKIRFVYPIKNGTKTVYYDTLGKGYKVLDLIVENGEIKSRSIRSIGVKP